MSSISTNLAYIAKTSAKLESAKSVKDSMTDQQQNFSNIINSFNMSDTTNLINEASLSKALKSLAFYQHLDCSHINV
jgi:hypothetical protein